MREIRDKRGMRGYTALEEKRDACLCPTIRNRGEATSVARPPKKGGWKSGIKFALPRYRKSSVRRERILQISSEAENDDWLFGLGCFVFPRLSRTKIPSDIYLSIYVWQCERRKVEKQYSQSIVSRNSLLEIGKKTKVASFHFLKVFLRIRNQKYRNIFFERVPWPILKK